MRRKLLVLGASTLGVLGTAKVCKERQIYDYNSIGLVRLSRAVSTTLSIGFIYKWHLYHVDQHSDLYVSRLSHCHRLGAEKFLQLCQLNKGN